MNRLASVGASVFAILLSSCAAQPKSETASSDPVASSSFGRSFPTLDLSRVSGNVVRHFIGGQIYYYVRSPCCDFHNFLFASDGSYLCAPDGGFTGRGDGKCPKGLWAKRSDGVVVSNPFYKP